MINIDCCFFVLTNVRNENKRKNDNKVIKLLVDKNNNLISVPYKKNTNIKDLIRDKIKKIIGNDIFHLEQVYTLGEEKYNKDGINIIYLGITNEENIKSLDKNYKLIDFKIDKKKSINLDNKEIKYDTKVRKEANSLEYYHVIKIDNINLEKRVIEILVSYKQILSKIDYTDIIFKFLPKYYTLEDVRIIYELIKCVSVDKSNFRKKIMKYCKETDKIINDKGHRPTKVYEFILDKEDIWI